MASIGTLVVLLILVTLMLLWDPVLPGNPARSPKFRVVREVRPNVIPRPYYYTTPRRMPNTPRKRKHSGAGDLGPRKRRYTI
ncbi:hypothetical protein MTO96_014017 [Rhipicephalus appendiculatus]|uniref:Secreted protein n=1 Tax=Rhipicephalus appendiculatus TaxID=34631 RepID=A0A131YD54_RHIAP